MKPIRFGLAPVLALGLAWLAPCAAQAQTETVTLAGSGVLGGSGTFGDNPAYTLTGSLDFDPSLNSQPENDTSIAGSLTLNGDLFTNLLYTTVYSQVTLSGQDSEGDAVIIYLSGLIGQGPDAFSQVRLYPVLAPDSPYIDIAPTGSANPAVPEPSSLLIAAGAMTVMMAAHRKRGSVARTPA